MSSQLKCPKCSELAAIVDLAIQGTAVCRKCGTRFFVNKGAAAALRKQSAPAQTPPAPAAPPPTVPATFAPATPVATPPVPLAPIAVAPAPVATPVYSAVPVAPKLKLAPPSQPWSDSPVTPSPARPGGSNHRSKLAVAAAVSCLLLAGGGATYWFVFGPGKSQPGREKQTGPTALSSEPAPAGDSIPNDSATPPSATPPLPAPSSSASAAPATTPAGATLPAALASASSLPIPVPSSISSAATGPAPALPTPTPSGTPLASASIPRPLPSVPDATVAPPARRSLKDMFAEFAPAVPVINAVDVGTGTGFLVDHGGRLVVITNRHVVEPAPKGLSLKFISGRSGQETSHTVGPDQTRVIAIHRQADLALIELDRAAVARLPATVKPLKLATVDQLPEPGEGLFAIGHPGTGGGGILERTLTNGILSARGRKVGDDIRNLQITVAINPGNSGGPLFNEDGLVVGVNSFIIRKNEARNIALEALNFAIEIGHVYELLDDPRITLSSGEIAGIVSPPESDLADLEASQKAFVEQFKVRRQKALDDGFRAYGNNDIHTHRVYELGPDRRMRINITFRADEKYLTFASALGSDDIDLHLVADDGTILAKDEGDDATPKLDIEVGDDGRYSLIVSNAGDAKAVILLGVFEK